MVNVLAQLVGQLELADGNGHDEKTKPAARFTEAGLIRELEKRGIDRPSTYGVILDTIMDA